MAYVQAVALEKLMVGYHEKRANIWKRVWKLCMQTEVEFSGVLKQFYESFK